MLGIFNGVGEHVHVAANYKFRALDERRMREDKFSFAMSFGSGGLHNVRRHGQEYDFAFTADWRNREKFDDVRAAGGVLVDNTYGFFPRGRLGERFRKVRRKFVQHVIRNTVFGEQWRASGQDTGTGNLSRLNSCSNRDGIGEQRTGIYDGCESVARQPFLELL